MTRSFWRKQHKWFGLLLCFFLLMFSISGIILNHRHFYSKVNVSRALLPPGYKYRNWNAGLMRGTLPYDSVATLIYGYAGIWKYDGRKISDFNLGLPEYADYRVIRNIIMTPDSNLFAAGQYGLYRRSLSGNSWQNVTLEQTGRHERIADITVRGDSLVLLTRDNIYLSLPPYRDFKRVRLDTPDNYDGKVSLFRVFWLLHNGEMFGIAGRIAVDLFAIAMILLCITGFLFWISPKVLKKTIQSKRHRLHRFIKTNYKWHKRIGIWTFFLMLFVVITGWCLRPPLLIPLALNKMPGIAHTAISPEDVWKDKLRAIRYDSVQEDWVLVTSDGFFSQSESFDGQPIPIPGAPHVSVMGINAFQKDDNGDWLVGSLGGMWRWDRNRGKVTDYFTAEPMPEKAGPPFGKTPVSGFSADLGEPCVVEYYNGTETLPQPDELRNRPMSLWQLALEVHTGRIYNLFGLAPLIWIFLIGVASLWVLVSGWKLRH